MSIVPFPTHPARRHHPSTRTNPPRESGQNERLSWRCTVRVDKRRGGAPMPYATIEREGNMLMHGGASALWDLLIGAANVTAFSNANAYIGVGDSDTPNAATMTDLQASSNKLREAMDSTFPTHTDGTTSAASSIVFKATFETSDANFAWKEIALFNASTAGRMLNRKTGDWGTKTSADEWVVTMTLTIA